MRTCEPARAARVLARTGRGPMRVGPARACELTTLARPAFFLRAGPTGQALIAIPTPCESNYIYIYIYIYKEM